MKNIKKSSGEFRLTCYVKHYFVLLMNLDQFKCKNFIQIFIHVSATGVLCSQFISSQNCQNYGWKWTNSNILTQ
jgi:hypothetical protein